MVGSIKELVWFNHLSPFFLGGKASESRAPAPACVKYPVLSTVPPGCFQKRWKCPSPSPASMRTDAGAGALGATWGQLSPWSGRVSLAEHGKYRTQDTEQVPGTQRTQDTDTGREGTAGGAKPAQLCRETEPG